MFWALITFPFLKWIRIDHVLDAAIVAAKLVVCAVGACATFMPMIIMWTTVAAVPYSQPPIGPWHVFVIVHCFLLTIGN